MSSILDDAIEILRNLPEQAQRAAAHAIIDYSNASEMDYAELALPYEAEGGRNS